MPQNPSEEFLGDLQSKFEVLEHFLSVLEKALPNPLFYDSGQAHYGYRYEAPDARHFCLLKSTRAVSGLNACIQLAKGGFIQEIQVVIRTIAEYCAQIEFVLPEKPNEENVRPEAARYVKEYFSDYKRNTAKDVGKLSVNQSQMHAVVGASMDRADVAPVV